MKQMKRIFAILLCLTVFLGFALEKASADVQTLRDGDSFSISTDEYDNGNGYGYGSFPFIPETSGYYRFTGSFDRSVDQLQNVYCCRMTNGEEVYFGIHGDGISLTDKLTAGQEYEFKLYSPDYDPVEASFTVSVYPENAAGDDIIWTYSDGTLSFTGSGAMWNSDAYGYLSPWRQYKEEITAVEIGEGITNCNALRIIRKYNVDLPNLATLTLPSTLTSISLFTIDDEPLQTIQFSGTKSDWFTLNKANNDFSNVTVICTDGEIRPEDCGDHASWIFDADTGVLTISGTGSIWDFLITGLNNSVPWSEYSDSITRVVIEEGITAMGQSMLYSLVNVTRLDLPVSVAEIHEGAMNLSSIQDIYYAGTESQLNAIAVEDLNYSITHATIHCLSESGDEVIADLSKKVGSRIECSFEDGTLTLTGTGATWSYDVESGMAQPWYNSKDQVTAIVVEEGITALGDDLFCELPNLAQVSLPDSLTEIGRKAFSNAVSLEEIDLPAGLQQIGNQAFFGCQSLGAAELPEGLESMGMMAFAGCTEMQQVTLPASLTKISYGCFTSCYSLEEVEFPETVTEIYESAFADCENLRAIRFNGDAPTIAYNAFAGVIADAYYDSSLDGWDEATLDDYGGSLNWITEEELLPAPTNLRWGWCPEHSSFGQIIPAHEENGMISFTANEPGYYYVTLYRTGESGDVTLLSSYVRAVSAGEDLVEDSFVRRASFYGSGTYYFTVQAVGESFNSNQQSEVVRSEPWTYIMPDAQVAAPVNVRWVDGNIVAWDAPQDESNIQYYMLYSSYGETPFNWYGVREIRVEPGVTSYDIQATSPGWYSMTVMAWTDDITVAVNSNSVQLHNIMVADSVLPDALETIETGAFENSGFRYVALPVGTAEIQSRTFANCETLKAVEIPATVTSIAGDAFDGAANVVLYVQAGSYAESYAIEHELQYKVYTVQ